MSFEEWEQCQNPFQMLWYLRGEVPEDRRSSPSSHGFGGDLYSGLSDHATLEQCVELAKRVAGLWSIITSREFGDCRGQWGQASGDVHDLVSLENFLSTAAWTASDAVAAASMGVTCSDASEEEHLVWAWGGGSPDPLWQATRSAFQVLQANLIRSVFKYPDIARPSTGRFRPDRDETTKK